LIELGESDKASECLEKASKVATTIEEKSEVTRFYKSQAMKRENDTMFSKNIFSGESLY
jgi:hypothetical protein